MKLRTRLAATAFVAVLGTLAFASSASAAFHQIMVREVYLGTGINDAFVELQMWAPGQTQVAGQKVDFYGPDGSGPAASFTIPSNVPNGQNQRTILIGDDATPGADVTYNMLEEAVGVYSSGGAVCFSGSQDCVAWGNFVDDDDPVPNNYNGASGSPVLPGGIPTGASITRSLTKGCQTALDAKDDTNDSAADFRQTNTPSPRGNTKAITERPCAGLRCGGKAVTYVGTNKKDVINGTGRADVVIGKGGNDTIRGRGGKDTLCGGKGRDKLIGGAGRDKLLGQGGLDILRGGPGRDTQVQ